MRFNYSSTFFCSFWVSLIFGVKAFPQLTNSSIKTNRQAFHGNVGKYTNMYKIIGDDVVLPCNVNSPDYSVVCYHDGYKIDMEGTRISYDPKKGLVIRNVTTKNSGYYQCYDNVYHHTISYMLHVTKKLADMYNPVISKPDEDEMILGEQIRLNCTAEFSHESFYHLEWKIPHQSDRVSINTYELENDMNTHVQVQEVVIDKADSSDQGEYVCTASSGSNTKSAKINVQLKKPPLVNCSSKKDLARAIAGLKDSLLQEMKSGLEAFIINTVEQSVSKNIELQLASIKSKLDQYLLS
ncbi:GSCOCG00002864001-RA-CDS [Cotesia congregata]|nr:GSCOCG00002864001-RA-CDS [Cotesia congregata]